MGQKPLLGYTSTGTRLYIHIVARATHAAILHGYAVTVATGLHSYWASPEAV